MATTEISLTFYPIPAPKTEELLFETDVLTAIKEIGANLLRNKDNTSITQEKIVQHFKALLNVTNLTHHMALCYGQKEIDHQKMLKELQIFFPQMVWIRIETEPIKYGRRMYYFSFIPLNIKAEGFPFGTNFQESLQQQFPESKNLPETVARLIQQRIEANQLAKMPIKEEILSPKQDKSLYKMIENQIQKQEPESEAEFSILEEDSASIEESSPSTNHQLLQVQEEVKREKYAKERMKMANEQLELLLDKLELSMIHYGVSAFNQRTEEDDERWDKRIKIDLREYTYLLQKAKYLEQMWRINDHLVNKSEKMTVTETSLIYEREQVNQIKTSIAPEDMYFVIYECQVIESRVKIHEKPWFKKPYVKLMKLDYDNLVSKAAYFDLLQGESYVLRKMTKHRQPRTADLKEDG